MWMLEEIARSTLGNLHHYRENTSVYVDLVVNLSLGLIGVAAFLIFSGWVSWLGALWAILNFAPIVTWVIGL